MVRAGLGDHPAGALAQRLVPGDLDLDGRRAQARGAHSPLSSARIRWAIRAAPRPSIERRSRSLSSRAQVVVGKQALDAADDVLVVHERADAEEDDAGVVAEVRVGRVARAGARTATGVPTAAAS